MANTVHHRNPHIEGMDQGFEQWTAMLAFAGLSPPLYEDVLYHLGLDSGVHDLEEMFGDVKFVCMGGTPNRMENFAYFLLKEIGVHLPTGATLKDISKHSHRYSMFKVGPVLSISHGMGVPSLSILLHEVIKLLSHAGAVDPIFFRIGTCGGIGLPGGTVVVTEEAIDGLMQPHHECIILGKRVSRPTHVDKSVCKDLMAVGEDMPFDAVLGKTMCTHDFYEGQGRLDGAFCEYSIEDKLNYLQELSDAGVRNIEMEATAFAALTHYAGIRSAVVCVTLLDRLEGDQVTATKEQMGQWQLRPCSLVAAYIKKELCIPHPQKREPTMGRVRSSQRFSGYEDDRTRDKIYCTTHDQIGQYSGVKKHVCTCIRGADGHNSFYTRTLVRSIKI